MESHQFVIIFKILIILIRNDIKVNSSLWGIFALLAQRGDCLTTIIGSSSCLENLFFMATHLLIYHPATWMTYFRFVSASLNYLYFKALGASMLSADGMSMYVVTQLVYYTSHCHIPVLYKIVMHNSVPHNYRSDPTLGMWITEQNPYYICVTAKYFLAWLLIGWQHSRQPIRSHV